MPDDELRAAAALLEVGRNEQARELLGRYLASDNPYFYDHLGFIDPDKEAAKYNIYPRFAIERAAARASTVFTTVSEVTAREAEKLLGRRPECILPNGLNIHRFAAPHEFQHLHAVYKQRISTPAVAR